LSSAPGRRLFFALWPDEAQRAALMEATGQTVRHCGGRPVPGSSLHVTLAFLGSVPEPRIADLSDLARGAAATFPGNATPLGIALQGCEYWAKPQVLAVLERGVPAQLALPSGALQLARTLTTTTVAAGFSPDLKPFRAHVTVARKVARAPRPNEMREVRWSFDSFALLESRTLPEGPVYSVVGSYLLGSAEKVRT
jgi:RNA 2',3'-cyclic 3'-phosphodiesterase